MEEFHFSKNLPLAKLVIIQDRLAELIAEKKESKLYYIPVCSYDQNTAFFEYLSITKQFHSL